MIKLNEWEGGKCATCRETYVIKENPYVAVGEDPIGWLIENDGWETYFTHDSRLAGASPRAIPVYGHPKLGKPFRWLSHPSVAYPDEVRILIKALITIRENAPINASRIARQAIIDWDKARK